MNQTKNVLSIDMDYIMAPCISLYNDLVFNDIESRKKIWEILEDARGIEKYISYDKSKLYFVFDIFAKALFDVSDEKNIMFAKDHDSILRMLCDEKNVNNKYYLYNIDHHHDIYYNDVQKKEASRFSFAGLANWVYYLGENDMLMKYFWIRNENSEVFTKEQINELSFPTCFTDNPFETNIFDVKFDYIFVCNSPAWLPENFDHFFNILKCIAENKYKKDIQIELRPFSEDGKSVIIK